MFPLKDNIPTGRVPVVTVLLIAGNVLFYLLVQRKTGIDLSGNSLNERSVYEYAAAMFSHAGLLHLGGNMVFLWIFGTNVEDSMGRVRFLVFYLLAGLGALAAQVLVEPDAVVPTLGASGAVAGVLAGYLVLYPGGFVVGLVLVRLFAQRRNPYAHQPRTTVS